MISDPLEPLPGDFAAVRPEDSVPPEEALILDGSAWEAPRARLTEVASAGDWLESKALDAWDVLWVGLGGLCILSAGLLVMIGALILWMVGQAVLRGGALPQRPPMGPLIIAGAALEGLALVAAVYFLGLRRKGRGWE
ncbi:MAG: hypothetical protein IRY99_16020, partial [Isosphaeraceae bacterium]|nr:hypothetical protein [Isosphaeraceae bacterium]